MFNKILIANRGEIARRIIRTAKKMGIKTVAIYSSIDSQSPHVLEADEAFCVGEAFSKDSYLNIPAIIKAAKESQAQAIHPGYGFLSENISFAQACAAEDIIFIGPPIAAISAMASKQLSKQLLEKTKVPLIPGYHGSNQSDDYLLKQAEIIGFPVLLKAANGGGGKGMRQVFNSNDFLPALHGARRESQASFADDTIIIEKLLTTSRHIEVQLMADQYGDVVHLFERDCSIQRRHQKIIEEAPAAHLLPRLRESITQAACEVAQTIHYCGAGTVEFLVDEQNHFYFMEMNTRLQVEHPVTEMITGLDLVAWQIHIAAGEHLPLTQEEIDIKGHAIEARIYAEDPHKDFIPSIGKIDFLQEPEGPFIRVDSGIEVNSFISQYYDPMLAKLIVWGENRLQAVQTLKRALSQYLVGGIKTNLHFLQAICDHPDFLSGNFNTAFLSQETLSTQEIGHQDVLMLAAAIDYWHLVNNSTDALRYSTFSWSNNRPLYWNWHYVFHEQIETLRISAISPECFQLNLGNDSRKLHIWMKNNQIWVNDGRQVIHCHYQDFSPKLRLYLHNFVIELERYNENIAVGTVHDNKEQLKAPMPATIVAILKKEGETVKAGERLMILEAMKMEHTIHAPHDGILAELFYGVGSQVEEGVELLALEE